MNNKTRHLLGLLLLFLFTSCIGDVEPTIEPPTIAGLKEDYTTIMGQKLTFAASIVSATTPTIEWLDESGNLLSKENPFEYEATAIGSFTITLRVSNEGGKAESKIRVNVSAPDNIKLAAGKMIAFNINPSWANDRTTIEVTTKPSDDARFGAGIMPDKKFGFTAITLGEYVIELRDGDKVLTSFNISVEKPEKKIYHGLTKVYAYDPAPGQFVNNLPKYEEGDTYESMRKKAEESITAKSMMDRSLITLGGWGGSIVMGFDHTVPNVKGLMDFRIDGNAFVGNANGRPDAPYGGSCEPGVIYVSYDANGNGIPDDTWYEIKGSGSYTAKNEPWWGFVHPDGQDDTIRDYEMTYYRPTKEDPEIEGVKDDANNFMTIKDYIKWENNQGESGYKIKNVYHDQTYYPMWVKEDKITFKGIRLANNAIDEGKFNPGINDASIYFVLYAYRWGYVDNYENRHDNASTDISWAIDKDGKSVELPGIDFIKVVCGVDKENGWLGEASTEINWGIDHHAKGNTIKTLTLPAQ